MSTALSVSIPEATGLANSIIQARSMLPRHITNPGEALAVILAGSELGLPPMTSIRHLRLIQGSVTISAEALLAIAIRGGVRHQWMRTDDEGATLRLTRSGWEPCEVSFTRADAERAGLLGNPTWKKFPAAMCRARAISAATRAFCPDLTMGAYVHGEIPESGAEVPYYEPPAAPAPVPAADAKWSDEDRTWFCAQLQGGPYSYEEVAAFCGAQGWPRPSRLQSAKGRTTRQRLEALLARIQSEDGRHDMEEFLGRVQLAADATDQNPDEP